MKYIAELDKTEFEIEVPAQNSEPVLVNDQPERAELISLHGSGHFLLFVEGASFELFIDGSNGDYTVAVGSSRLRVSVVDEKTRYIQSLIKTEDKRQKQVEVKAPMPGLISKVLVAEGDEVEKGTPLLLIEAMKMENEICAVAAGVVKKVRAVEGQSVDKDTFLMSVE